LPGLRRRLAAAGETLAEAQAARKRAETDFDAATDRFTAAEQVLDAAREERARARQQRYAARQAHERAEATVQRLQRRVGELAERLDRLGELVTLEYVGLPISAVGSEWLKVLHPGRGRSHELVDCWVVRVAQQSVPRVPLKGTMHALAMHGE
jgi:DNA repair exonuclease SbcCD ATPase subunit